ncbi:hypothetical protein FUAX_09520 [Fulvitalea axinellae]|uniref:SusD/RagB family nutrient-binding outer membrane lipoprotein n=2 Tax=Fulvitalea axinellae TaxID=1182444 RepID=A0AAU9D8E0_9BACT|nr:hypothetical protein FUAX_09520 [Fulvitalea axinellae]
MRKYIKAGLLAFALAACTDKDFDDVNRGLNQLDETKPVYLLNATLKKTYVSDAGFGNTVCGEWIHHVSRLNTLQYEYEDFSASSTGLWDGVYLMNSDFGDVLRRTENTEDANEQSVRALTLIGKALAFSRLTDVYGDVPYFTASTFVDGEVVEKTPYDSQEAIYKDLLAKLEEAVSLLEGKAVLDMTGADRVYQGDLMKWKRFANSLRFRLAMRLSNVAPDLAADVISDVQGLDLIDSEENSAIWENSTDIGYENPMYGDLQSGNRAYTGGQLVNFLKDNEDPRLAVMAMTVRDTDEFNGFPNGAESVNDLDDYSYIGEQTYEKWVPTPVFLYSEMCFLKAEAYLRGIGMAKDETMANEWYRKGVESSLNYWSYQWIDRGRVPEAQPKYGEAEIEAFMAKDIATLSGTTEEKYRQIMEQKWVSLFCNHFEAYAEGRRSGYPEIKQRQAVEDGLNYNLGETNGVMPRRVKYPVKQGTFNPEYYQQAIDKTDGNSFLYRVWWDNK